MKWNKVADKTPPISQVLLVAYKDDGEQLLGLGVYTGIRGDWRFSDFVDNDLRDVEPFRNNLWHKETKPTHWMPLPLPPTESETP